MDSTNETMDVAAADDGATSITFGTFTKTIYFPIVGIFGLIGNIISFIAFKRKFKEYKTFLSLMILIACDCCTIYAYWQFAVSTEVIAKVKDKSIYFWVWFHAYIPITCLGFITTLSSFILALIMVQRIHSIRRAVEFAKENHVRKIWITFSVGVCIVSVVTLPQLLTIHYVQPVVSGDNVTIYVEKLTGRNPNATFYQTHKVAVLVMNSFRITQAIALLPLNIYFIVLFRNAAKMNRITKPIMRPSFGAAEKIAFNQRKLQYESERNAAVVNICLSVQCCLYFLSELIIVIFLSLSLAGYSRRSEMMVTIQSSSQMIKVTTASLNFPFYYILSSEFRTSIKDLFRGNRGVFPASNLILSVMGGPMGNL